MGHGVEIRGDDAMGHVDRTSSIRNGRSTESGNHV